MKINFIRNDLTTFEGGTNGGKAICINRLLNEGVSQGYKSFVTSGSRTSPQLEIISTLCKYRNLECHIFIPKGKDTKTLEYIRNNTNAIIHESNANYQNTANAQAQKFVMQSIDKYYIPFGCECWENLDEIYKVLEKLNLPNVPSRIVVPIGSGTTFCGVINALTKLNLTNISVLGVQVGMKPDKTIERFMNTLTPIHYEIVQSELDYKTLPEVTTIEGVDLDSQYEAKCIPFLKENDYLWIVAKRLT